MHQVRVINSDNYHYDKIRLRRVVCFIIRCNERGLRDHIAIKAANINRECEPDFSPLLRLSRDKNAVKKMVSLHFQSVCWRFHSLARSKRAENSFSRGIARERMPEMRRRRRRRRRVAAVVLESAGKCKLKTHRFGTLDCRKVHRSEHAVCFAFYVMRYATRGTGEAVLPRTEIVSARYTRALRKNRKELAVSKLQRNCIGCPRVCKWP